MKTAIEYWYEGSLPPLKPVRVVATIEAQCNLACLHCYWAHDMGFKSISDWTPAIKKLREFNVPLLYAGRLLTKAGSNFLRECRETLSGLEIGIIDNGYTILDYPEFLADYAYINISIDGDTKAHDTQRNKSGSSQRAWDAIFELKKQGFDPIITSAFSPFSFDGWERFEEKAAEHNVPISSTLVWDVAETAKRGTAIFTDTRLLKEAFAQLTRGVPKIINIYSQSHIHVLSDMLTEYEWAMDTDAGDSFTATLPTGTVIVYRPATLIGVAEAGLRWDGKFYTSSSYLENVEYGLVTPEWCDKLSEHMKAESSLWKYILERR